MRTYSRDVGDQELPRVKGLPGFRWAGVSDLSRVKLRQVLIKGHHCKMPGYVSQHDNGQAERVNDCSLLQSRTGSDRVSFVGVSAQIRLQMPEQDELETKVLAYSNFLSKRADWREGTTHTRYVLIEHV